MSTECEEVRISLGVYVLGAIDPAERAAVDAHLSVCPSCRDELAGMAALPALLGRVSEAQIAALAEPPGELLETLLARAASDRRPSWRRRWSARWKALWSSRWTPLVAAAAVMLVVGALFGGLLDDRFDGSPPVTAPGPSQTGEGPSPSTTGERLQARDADTGVSAELLLFAKNSGTQAELRLSGVSAGSRCRLEAINRQGRHDIMGSWRLDHPQATFVGSTMFRRAEVASFQVVADDGRPLVTIPAE
ncbi:anti-sigma factor family protein [Thermomonospora curvata]|uniref:Putative zinc-finger domain-containing protein n=1 Tax=Thermomonospora curvata (strain ATCC 19995 / DSM 43183 / JCM 3096 / KCTC 9072 / NBRC 15933 / NCIMB 10081 / Henssen B9) TaxID=471852 RepID=D1A4F9_THECD|nr:zf-HC2 domain-containing protein [Thermomonospora curvata]ACY96194.1 hypothetical protein Tcur_0599 [Thermomonospora curvata DSM 43183]